MINLELVVVSSGYMELLRAFNAKTLVFVSWPRFVWVEEILVSLTDRSTGNDASSSAGSSVVDMFSFVFPDAQTTDRELAALQALRPLETEPAIGRFVENSVGKILVV